MRVAVTRPAVSGAAFAAALAARGHEALSAPLLEIHPLAADLPDLADYQALLATSANAFLALDAEGLAGAARLHAVGEATAAAARAAGARDVRAAAGDAVSLEAEVLRACRPEAGPLLYLCGSVRRVDLAGQLRAAGFQVTQIETYDARPLPELPEALREGLRAGSIDALAFFSPRTARSFVRLLCDAGLQDTCGQLTAVCLSAAVAAELEGLTWRRVALARSPDQEALLAALEIQD